MKRPNHIPEDLWLSLDEDLRKELAQEAQQEQNRVEINQKAEEIDLAVLNALPDDLKLEILGQTAQVGRCQDPRAQDDDLVILSHFQNGKPVQASSTNNWTESRGVKRRSNFLDTSLLPWTRAKATLRDFSSTSTEKWLLTHPADREYSENLSTLQVETDDSDEEVKVRDTLFVDAAFPPQASSIDGRRGVDHLQSEISIKCRCGKKARLQQVWKSNENQGREFWGCPSYRKGESCGFFAWADQSEKFKAGHSDRDARMEWKRLLSGPSVPKNPITGENLLTIVRATPNGHDFLPGDVKQGAVGDCWFMSAVSVIAERLDLIDRVMMDKSTNATGRYRVRLFGDGQWRIIELDDFFPQLAPEDRKKGGERKTLFNDGSDPSNPPLAFCKVSRGQIWVCLLEKAYAKMHGSYKAISGGWIAEALHDLTSFPCETISFVNQQDYDELWARMLGFREHGLLMGASCPMSGQGLVGRHAYSLIDVREIQADKVNKVQQATLDGWMGTKQTSKGKEKLNPATMSEFARELYGLSNAAPLTSGNGIIRLCRLRNPWGHGTWSGDWSKESTLWTAELKKELGMDIGQEKDDGTFWIAYEDFLRRFSSLDVCHCHRGWHALSMHCTLLPNASMPLQPVELKITEPTWLWLSLIQKTKRGKKGERFWYTDLSLVVLKKKQHSCTVEKFLLTGPKRTLHAELMLDDVDASYFVFPVSLMRECVRAQGGISSLNAAQKRVTKPDTAVRATIRVFSQKPVSMRFGLLNQKDGDVRAWQNGAWHTIAHHLSQFTRFDHAESLVPFCSLKRQLTPYVTVHLLESSGGVCIALIRNTDSERGIKVRALIHGAEEGAVSWSHSTNGQTPWCFVPPESQRVLAGVTVNQSYDQEMGNVGQYALDQVEFEEWQWQTGNPEAEPIMDGLTGNLYSEIEQELIENYTQQKMRGGGLFSIVSI